MKVAHFPLVRFALLANLIMAREDWANADAVRTDKLIAFSTFEEGGFFIILGVTVDIASNFGCHLSIYGVLLNFGRLNSAFEGTASSVADCTVTLADATE